MNRLSYLVLSTLLFLFACKSPSSERKDTLVKAEAPDAITKSELGYALPGLNHGLLQSPINIRTQQVANGQHEVVTHYQSSSEHVAYLGHTVQVNYDSGSLVAFDGKFYNFKQFHFHTPSEHHIDGITYPLEMHMVHTCTVAGDHTDEPLYLVIGVIFKEGKENEFLNKFLSEIPTHEGETVDLPSKRIDISELIAHETDHFYYYRGSLTTPPFTESVNWTILKKIFEASPEQIERLNRLEGNNARHIQALYGRTVEGI